MKENLYQLMKERYDHGDKLFPEHMIVNMMYQVRREFFGVGILRVDLVWSSRASAFCTSR